MKSTTRMMKGGGGRGGRGGGWGKGGGGGFKLDGAKIRAKGKVETKTKDETNSTTTNKQDPQHTPAGRRITSEGVCHPITRIIMVTPQAPQRHQQRIAWRIVLL